MNGCLKEPKERKQPVNTSGKDFEERSSGSRNPGSFQTHRRHQINTNNEESSFVRSLAKLPRVFLIRFYIVFTSWTEKLTAVSGINNPLKLHYHSAPIVENKLNFTAC